MLPSPTDLVYFLEIAHTLNISRAAERLGISQPSLSLCVKRLEAAVGSPLLVRGQSGVQLTRSGQRFAREARQLVQEWERLRSDLKRDELEVSGRYVIGCHASVALYSLPATLAALMEEHRDLEIKLVHGLSRQITDQVIGFQIDFGIVINPAHHPDLVIKPLAKDEVGFWVHGKKTRQVAAAKQGDGTLVCDPDLVQTQTLLKEAGKQGLGFRRTLATGSLELITALVDAGAGLGILPGRVVEASGRKSLVRVAGAPLFRDQICLVYRADAQKTAATKELVRSLQGCL